MNIAVKDLGTCNYNIALSTQEITREKLIQNSGVNTLFLVEHDHIYTLGKHANPKNILNNNCEIIQTDRGGDVTYHGPGQLVGYPIIDLKKMKLGVKSYVKNIELLLIATLHDYKIDAHIKEGNPGVWVNNKKIGSIGIRVSRGITTHGFSLNVNTDMKYFSNIISCGIDDVLMTSMEKELGTNFFMNDIKQSIILHFNQLFKAQ
ncbi:lipoyl(octanoyl) transferase LipB [Candidatus Marinimicrobia bacterium]|jgi:lipoyl(octanoyl) transferase|nr:lipoyl(octanoyl) transferase LipB [Candidatus Neomarinimicrobiota bacterium]MDB3979917.1 lipoyl(octanoyl) transferase LipB [Candidatus Neomarinimicrobiota bacterium]MDC0593983.1 lipoyl(octanoyl) transferase LipB [Candidatus Neomarinimicrobiota bacterium]MDC0878149.1 lipoyl(octanoyl) transferase LipB [Candidatus Neomarinimicrobiota bacterium]MDC1000655.1 lipoyl(octanoyl) transferase LipB [Candidatus Neomarinimicrobiota bacterium]|tara:strand:+ start:9611 stop:10225 length:615 start_codon:yes stop_codon:yes gene_type:complete